MPSEETGKKWQVYQGTKDHTAGGLKKDQLVKNKHGKIVSKKQQTHGKTHFKAIQKWSESVSKAREHLGTEGFVAINGKSAEGKELYRVAKRIHSGEKKKRK